MIEIKCKICEVVKPINDFYKTYRVCKVCTSVKTKKYREENKEFLKISKRKEYIKNKESYITRSSKRYKLKKNDIHRQLKEKRKNNPVFRELANLRSKLSSALRRYILGGVCRERALIWGILGCSRDCFVQHLEAQFKDGMSWDNYGRGGWELDHIKPLSQANSVEEVRTLFNYKNIQPLWKIDNMAKFNKTTPYD